MAFFEGGKAAVAHFVCHLNSLVKNLELFHTMSRFEWSISPVEAMVAGSHKAFAVCFYVYNMDGG